MNKIESKSNESNIFPEGSFVVGALQNSDILISTVQEMKQNDIDAHLLILENEIKSFDMCDVVVIEHSAQQIENIKSCNKPILCNENIELEDNIHYNLYNNDNLYTKLIQMYKLKCVQNKLDLYNIDCNIFGKYENSKNTKKLDIKYDDVENEQDVKIVLVSCVYGRPELTDFIFSIITKLDFEKIIIVYSNPEDYENLKHYENIEFVQHQNLPLSKKWQAGISSAKKYNPDGVMILGSDDLISKNYLKLVKKYIKEGYDYVCVDKWLSSCFSRNNFVITSCHYDKLRTDGLGSGRVIAKTALDKIDWNLYVFRKPINAGLDGTSFYMLKKHITKMMKISTPEYHVLLTKMDQYIKSVSIKNLPFHKYMLYYTKERHWTCMVVDTLDNYNYSNDNLTESVVNIFDNFVI